jgi:fluoride exporter
VRAYLAVAVGGLIGTGLRLACDLAFPHIDGELPVETFLVNLAGAFALGWLVGGLWTRPTMPTWLKAGLGSGVLGSFTTLSAVMASLLVLTRAGEPWLAGLYLGVSVVGGIALAAFGLRIGSLIAHRPMPTEVTDAGETL